MHILFAFILALYPLSANAWTTTIDTASSSLTYIRNNSTFIGRANSVDWHYFNIATWTSPYSTSSNTDKLWLRFIDNLPDLSVGAEMIMIPATATPYLEIADISDWHDWHVGICKIQPTDCSYYAYFEGENGVLDIYNKQLVRSANETPPLYETTYNIGIVWKSSAIDSAGQISTGYSTYTPFEFSTTTLDSIPASFIYSLFNGTNGAVTPIQGYTFTNYPTSTNTFNLETNAALIKGGSMTVIGGVLPTTTDSYGQVAVDDLNAAILAGDLNAIGTSSLYQQSYELFLSTTSTSSVLAYAQRAFPFNLILGLGYAVASFATNTVNTYNNTSHAVTVTMPGDKEIVLLNFASTTALAPVFNQVRGYLGILTYFMWLLGMTGLGYRLVVGNRSGYVSAFQSKRA